MLWALYVTFVFGIALAEPAIAQSSRPREASNLGSTFGTAFFVSTNGQALTNAHVVEDCEEVRVDLEGRSGAARVVARDKKNDLALLATDLHPVQSPNWRLSVRQGEDIVVYGFPLTGVLASGGNVVTGNVTALAGIGNDSRFLQISAPIQPGNSGGPLLDRNGNVVGIVVAKLNALGVASATGDIPQNVNFAIKASVAAAFLDTQRVGHAEGGSVTALSTPDIAARATALTMQVACIATPAKPVAVAPKSVTVPAPRAEPEKTLLTIHTRFGELSVIRDADDCCSGKINYGAQKIELASAGDLFATLIGVYRVKEGDVLVLDVPAGVRGVPPIYHVFLVNQDRMSELRSPDFSSHDFTFEVTQKGDEIYFNLGVDKQRKKTAVYRDGVLSVSSEKRITSLPKKECARVLDMAANCVTTCPRFDHDFPNFPLPFAMSWMRDIRTLEDNMPVFTERKFVEVCANICATKIYNALQSRRVLCGY
jgi:hypothetical protein